MYVVYVVYHLASSFGEQGILAAAGMVYYVVSCAILILLCILLSSDIALPSASSLLVKQAHAAPLMNLMAWAGHQGHFSLTLGYQP